jgi:mitogen-activated protein kinase organizer 1
MSPTVCLFFEASVNCVRFNEESTVVMSGSVDTLVKIWDCRSRSQEPIQQLEDSKVFCPRMRIRIHVIFLEAGSGPALKCKDVSGSAYK